MYTHIHHCILQHKGAVLVPEPCLQALHRAWCICWERSADPAEPSMDVETACFHWLRDGRGNKTQVWLVERNLSKYKCTKNERWHVSISVALVWKDHFLPFKTDSASITKLSLYHFYWPRRRKKISTTSVDFQTACAKHGVLEIVAFVMSRVALQQVNCQMPNIFFLKKDVNTGLNAPFPYSNLKYKGVEMAWRWNF